MTTDNETWVDPDMQLAFARMTEIAREHDLPADRSQLTPEQARRRMEIDRAWWNQERPELALISDITVPGSTQPIPVRLLYPSTDTPLPVIVYLHGGGWVVGSLETHARGMHALAITANCVVAAVDYSLAPERKFPSAITEVVEVVDHITANPDDLGIDARRIALAIADSPLVKTAIAGEDANWGRIVMAVGKSGQQADRDRLGIDIGGIAVARDGARVEGFDEAPVAAHMKGREITIAVDVGVGTGRATVWTCDLTHGYIDINADYRS